MMRMQSNPSQNRDLSGRFLKGTSGNPAGRPLGFREQIKEITTEGSELVEVVHSVLIDANASNKERMDAATCLADRGFGKPTVNSGSQAPGIGDFTFIIGDHDVMCNPINDMPEIEASYSKVTPTDY